MQQNGKMSTSGAEEPSTGSSTITACEGASSGTITAGEESMSACAPSSSNNEGAAAGRRSSSSEDPGGSSASEEEYVFYCNRPEWKDVEPLPQDDGPYPVVRIAYTDKCEWFNQTYYMNDSKNMHLFFDLQFVTCMITCVQ